MSTTLWVAGIVYLLGILAVLAVHDVRRLAATAGPVGASTT
jgi:hypothetical protein